ncbi:MAG: sodium:solute symporter family protein [Acidobacteriota bacterium]|jgi:SSS family solute:Na+ symporter|nr:sodium:solute symporter family protein [Acidobacteriota bacterium]
MSTALIIALAYFLVLSGGVSLWARKRVKSGRDFVTGGGALAWPLVMAGFVLAPLGSGHTLSLWESSSKLGAAVLWWAIMSGGLMVPLFLLWFGPWFRRLGVQTFPEGMGKIFGEKIGWVISAVFPAQLLGICIAEVLATATAFYALAGGKEDVLPARYIILAIVLTILYIFVGGLMQAAWMNLFNATMLILGSFVAVFYTGGWLSDNGYGGYEGIAAHYAGAGEAWKTTLMNFSPDVVFTLIIPCLILTIFMQSASQVQNQPMLLARSESDVRRGVFWAAFINSMAAYPWVILGLVGMALPVLAVAPNLSVPAFAQMAFPPWLLGILMTSLLAATLSTTGGLILGASHIIVNDILKRALHPKMDDKTFLVLTRAMIVVCALLVIIPALRLPGILPLLYWVFSFAVPVFGVYLIGMLWQVNKVAAWTTLLAGYAANFYGTFAKVGWLPGQIGPSVQNVYLTIFATICFGVVLNLVLPGQPGYLRQLKAKKQESGN